MTKISHSSRGKYEHCSEMYRLHYIDKIRPIGTTSALVFGSAIDSAAENYLIEGNPEHAVNIFKHNWKQVKEQDYTAVEYHNNDLDIELLIQSDNELILKDTLYATVSDLVEDGKNQERIVLAKWASLYRKGLLIINAFIDWADNNIEEVLEAQCVIELEGEPYLVINKDGDEVEVRDEITGKADFVIKMKGYDVPLLVDLKTAARFYDRNSVKVSEQLALYYFYLKNTKYPEMKRAAFLVLQKQIKKNREKTCLTCGNVTHGKEQKCAVEIQVPGAKGKMKKGRCNGDFSVAIFPEVTVQFIHDEIPEHFINETVERFGYVINQINNKVFEKNLDGCANYYGKSCPYLKYCETGCMNGLIKKDV